MANRKINISIICLGILFILLICIDEKGLQESRPVFMEKFPQKYVKKNEAVEFNTDIILNNDNLYESTATKLMFNKEVVIPIIFKNNITDTDIDTDGANYTHINGSTLYIEGNYLSFNSNSVAENDVMGDFSLHTEQYTGDQYKIIEETDELSALTDKDNIEKLLYSLGMNNFNFYKAYIIGGQETHENIQNSGRYWIGCEMCQKLPVFCSSFYAGVIDAWAPMQVLCTENGIEKLQILYYFNFENTSKKIDLKAFDEIADALVKKYSMLLTDNRHVVTRAELSFWVDINQEDRIFEMVPVWVFSMKEYSGKSEKSCLEYQELVNAVTGEMLEVGE